MDIKLNYESWLNNTDSATVSELRTMSPEQIEDAFYRNLAFGTGGLRGVIGAGTNRMNIYTVAKATQGLASWLNSKYENPSVAIGYDSRINSDVFSKTAACVFAANGIKVNLWPQLMPVPTVSFAVRYLGCSAGVMITASHNPSKYNGYKVYGADGCQITTGDAASILEMIEATDIFSAVKKADFNQALSDGGISYIKDDVYTAYTKAVKNQSVLFGESISRNAALVYSPLNGAGLKPVLRVLTEEGYNNITVVEEQREPDGTFPTCPYPNPEIKEAMALGMEYARRCGADLLLATDPDCDRVGIAVKNSAGEYVLLSGNETGILLLDYICSRRSSAGKMPANPVMVKTIVTTDMAEKIASDYGVKTINVLTGFKFIGEQIGVLEKAGRAEDYIFGFEESYGCLAGTYVRDKDAVVGSLLICEMFSYYASKGVSLYERLQELYNKYGYCLNTLHSYQFEGSAGFEKMQSIMASLRAPGAMDSLGGVKITEAKDYSKGIDGLPASDVLKYKLGNTGSLVVRPSGTEPKLKAYFSVSAASEPQARETENNLCRALEEMLSA